jgi:hypothetical protein
MTGVGVASEPPTEPLPSSLVSEIEESEGKISPGRDLADARQSVSRRNQLCSARRRHGIYDRKTDQRDPIASRGFALLIRLRIGEL